jgi:addiction module HigA family antidote
MLRIPTNRAPSHPGEILREEFLAPMEISQVELAKRLNIPFQRVNQIVGEKRSVTPDTALRLAKLFETTPDLWLNLQLAWDLYHAQRSPKAKEIARIRRFEAFAGSEP